jgi:hypothetical protein
MMVYVLCWVAYLPVIPATGIEKQSAPDCDNSNPYRVAITVNSQILQRVIVDTGYEMVVVATNRKRTAENRPSIMRSDAVILWCAIERVTKALQKKPPSSFCFNPGTVTKDGTTVKAQVVVTHSKAERCCFNINLLFSHVSMDHNF